MNIILTVCFMLHVATVRCGLRVIGGRDVQENEFQYVVRLERHIPITIPGQQTVNLVAHVCTCSAITPTTTLTAAHCLAERATDYIIRYGQLKDNTISKVLSYVTHSKLLMSIMQVTNDVALLRTERIPLKQYARISTLDPHSLLGEQITLVGYGLTNSSKIRGTTLGLNKPLQVLDAVVIRCSSDSIAMTKLKKVSPLKPSMCVARRCGESAALCPGDSGGPALHPSGIVGLNSLAVHSDCLVKWDRDRSHIVVMLTPVSSFVGWISSHIN